jgi:hypothetical protein
MQNRKDQLVKQQFLNKVRQTETRRKHPVKIHIGEGSLCKGSVMDCSHKTFSEALHFYDKRLYYGWNPYKREGRGVWEVWYEPSYLTAVQDNNLEGYPFFQLVRIANDFEHHVKDLEFLNLDFIRQLGEMDMWKNKSFAKDLDEKIDTHEKKLEKELSESIKYTVKHNKKEFGQLKELAEHGYNPFWFFGDDKKKLK